ncbi:MAG: LysR family transcriptional regulator [Coriobacteriia bacterium]|nr:LysR family transcriptional regulator [Coriobacteriia bacterium]
MRLEQLRFFVEVSRRRSFSHAASHLFLTQQNISTGVRKLEEELGFKLFERTHSGVILTSLGEEVLVKAEEILEHCEALKAIGRAASRQLTGELRIELVPYIALPEIIVHFYRQNPAVSIKTTERAPGDIITSLQDGTADVGFVYLRTEETLGKIEELETPGLVQEMLSSDQLYLCVSKKLHFPKQSYTISELLDKKMSLVIFDSLYEWTMESFGMVSAEGPLIYRADAQVYKKMIQEGLAAGFGTKMGLDQEIIFKKGEVNTLRIKGSYLTVCMLYKESPSSSLKEDFISMIRTKFHEMSNEGTS